MVDFLLEYENKAVFAHSLASFRSLDSCLLFFTNLALHIFYSCLGVMSNNRPIREELNLIIRCRGTSHGTQRVKSE